MPPAVRHALDSLQANATAQSFRRGVANTASINRRYKSQQDMDVGLYISLFIRPTRSSEDAMNDKGNGLKYKSVPQFFELFIKNTMQGPPPPPTEVPFSRCCFGGVHTWW